MERLIKLLDDAFEQRRLAFIEADKRLNDLRERVRNQQNTETSRLCADAWEEWTGAYDAMRQARRELFHAVMDAEHLPPDDPWRQLAES